MTNTCFLTLVELFIKSRLIDVSEEDMAKISFLRQQDITKICEKISSVTLSVKKKQGNLEVIQARLEGVKESWIRELE